MQLIKLMHLLKRTQAISFSSNNIKPPYYAIIPMTSCLTEQSTHMKDGFVCPSVRAFISGGSKLGEVSLP